MNIIQKITVFIAILSGTLLVSAAVTPSAEAQELFRGSRGAACSGANLSNDTNCHEGRATNRVENTVKAIINILTAIVGIAAVILIIINGLRFITANGDSNAIQAARHGVIYAIVGLVIVALAQVIVRFVLARV